MTHIEHITIDSGHRRRSPRSEVAPGVAQSVSALIALSLDGQASALPDGLVLHSQRRGSLLLADVCDAALRPLVSIGVCPPFADGSALWRELHAGPRPAATDPTTPPESPWVAVRLRADLAGSPAVAWLGDFERCLAWAWIEHPL